ncbi:hypothetical protein AAKU55_005914 [Oxalobacteraceae bacterium GrIS 1.11]
MEYKENSVAGNAWRRFSRIVIDNARLHTPVIVCVEQEVIALEAGEVLRDVSNLNFPFNPGEAFAVLNPDTNEPTGIEASGAQVYALVYS